MAEQTYPLSPCVGLCQMDGNRQYCLGCGRTLDEIAGWSHMTAARKRRVLAELPARMNGPRDRSRNDESA